MAMPDAIEALLKLSIAQPNRLSPSAYNVRAFNPSADEIRASALRAFPDAEITYQVDAKRQAIVDSWPEDVDDTAATTRLGLRAGLRLRPRVSRVPDPDHSRGTRIGVRPSFSSFVNDCHQHRQAGRT